MFFTALELLSTAQSIGDAAACMRAFAPLFSSLDLRIGSAVMGARMYDFGRMCLPRQKPDTFHQSVWFRNGLLQDAVWVWVGGSRLLVNNMFSQN